MVSRVRERPFLYALYVVYKALMSQTPLSAKGTCNSYSLEEEECIRLLLIEDWYDERQKILKSMICLFYEVSIPCAHKLASLICGHVEVLLMQQFDVEPAELPVREGNHVTFRDNKDLPSYCRDIHTTRGRLGSEDRRVKAKLETFAESLLDHQRVVRVEQQTTEAFLNEGLKSCVPCYPESDLNFAIYRDIKMGTKSVHREVPALYRATSCFSPGLPRYNSPLFVSSMTFEVEASAARASLAR